MRGAVVVGLVACGSSHHQPDARIADSVLVDMTEVDARPDAVVDGMPDASVPGPVMITVYDSTASPQPVAGMPVLFQDAQGTVVLETTTDAQGQATAVMAAGGSVSAKRPQRSGVTGDLIYMFLGVKPGDHLLAGAPVTSPTNFPVTFQVPAYPGAYGYTLATQCGTGSSIPTSVTTLNAQLSCSPVDVYVRALDTTNQHNTLAAFYKTGVAVASGATIDLSGETYHGLQDVAVTLSNLPANVNQLSADFWLVGSFPFPDQRLTGGLASGQFSTTVPFPDITGLTLGALVEVRDQPQSGLPEAQELRQLVPYTTSYSLDVGAHAITWLTSVVGFNASTNSLFWFESAATPADYTRIELFVTPTNGDPRPRIQLEVAGPYAHASLALPQLSGDLATDNLKATDSLATQKFYVATVPGGWDAMRENVFNMIVWLPKLAVGETAVASAPSNGVLARTHAASAGISAHRPSTARH